MLIPWNTDAPIYHFPWMTIGLIGTNVAVFATEIAMGGEGFIAYRLHYGEGLQPVQWLTTAFLHLNFLHLIGNMIFLWAFGLVVEGKLGWWRFLLTYLAVAVLQSAIEQGAMGWITVGRSLGASGAIYGLLAMALIWAPENEMQCWWIWSRFGLGYGTAEIDISILWMAIFYIGIDLLFASLKGFRLSTELLHITGAVVGLVAGIGYLKLGWVDCEGGDVFTVMSGRHLRSGSAVSDDRTTASKDSDTENDNPSTAAERFLRQQEKFRKKLREKHGQAALLAYEKAVHIAGCWDLPEPDLIKLADLLCTENRLNEAVPFLENYITRFEKRADLARLRLAQILVNVQQRPSYALRVLGDLPTGSLRPEYEQLRLALMRKAETLVADGVLELEGRAW